MITYKLTNAGIVLRMPDRVSILPIDEEYQDYLRWVNAGNVPERETPLVIYGDKTIIIGDGEDTSKLSVQGLPNEHVTINALIGSTPMTIVMDLDEKGYGEEIISCETPRTILIFTCNDSEWRLLTL